MSLQEKLFDLDVTLNQNSKGINREQLNVCFKAV